MKVSIDWRVDPGILQFVRAMSRYPRPRGSPLIETSNCSGLAFSSLPSHTVM